jgi:hypothetical protein
MPFQLIQAFSQGLPLLSILVFFYNVKSINTCNFPTIPESGICFVDNVNALALGKSTENNCTTLKTYMSIACNCLGNMKHLLFRGLVSRALLQGTQNA